MYLREGQVSGVFLYMLHRHKTVFLIVEGQRSRKSRQAKITREHKKEQTHKLLILQGE